MWRTLPHRTLRPSTRILMARTPRRNTSTPGMLPNAAGRSVMPRRNTTTPGTLPNAARRSTTPIKMTIVRTSEAARLAAQIGAPDLAKVWLGNPLWSLAMCARPCAPNTTKVCRKEKIRVVHLMAFRVLLGIPCPAPYGRLANLRVLAVIWDMGNLHTVAEPSENHGQCSSYSADCGGS